MLSIIAVHAAEEEADGGSTICPSLLCSDSEIPAIFYHFLADPKRAG
jgi:hypothetical protein